MRLSPVLQLVPEGGGHPSEGVPGDEEGGGDVLAGLVLPVLHMAGSPPDLLLKELGLLAFSAQPQMGQNGSRDGGGGDLRYQAPVQVQLGNVDNVQNHPLL